MDGFSPKARFTFFGLSGCGHCVHFKEGVNGKPAAWKGLREDKDLYNAGVEFVLYQVGAVKDPKTGETKYYKPEPGYGKINGYPHFQLSPPSDKFNFIAFPMELVRGWDADKCIPAMKKWILDTIRDDPRFRIPEMRYRHESPPKATGIVVPQKYSVKQENLSANQDQDDEEGAGDEVEKMNEVEEVNANRKTPQRVNTDILNQNHVRTVTPIIPKQERVNPSSIIQNNTGSLAPPNKAKGNPTAFGMGSGEVKPQHPIVPQKRMIKTPPKFKPSNYDN